jgi:hypothetical protein
MIRPWFDRAHVLARGLLVTALLAAACGDKAKPDDATSSADASLRKKVNGYNGCVNGAEATARAARARYFSWFANPAAGPSGRETNIDIYALDKNGCDRCLAFLDGAPKVAPPLAGLDGAGTAFAAALRKVMPLVDPVRAYYEQKDWRDDHFAKGKALHGPLYAALQELAAAAHSLDGELDTVEQELARRELTALEAKYGRTMPFLRARLMSAADTLVRAGAQEGAQLAALSAALDELSKAIDEIGAYKTAHPASVGPANDFYYGAFVERATKLQLAGKERMRRIRDKVPYNAHERDDLAQKGSMAQLVEGSPPRMIATYNELVKASNELAANYRMFPPAAK